jgi:hypothetical protein
MVTAMVTNSPGPDLTDWDWSTPPNLKSETNQHHPGPRGIEQNEVHRISKPPLPPKMLADRLALPPRIFCGISMGMYRSASQTQRGREYQSGPYRSSCISLSMYSFASLKPRSSLISVRRLDILPSLLPFSVFANASPSSV